ncbi:MAG: hypothetical protein WC180_00130 [Candidatus Paceibacterota bacterium]
MTEESIAIEGKYLGRTFSEFYLHNLEPSMLGSDAFTEVYFETTSGNEYLIFRPVDRNGEIIFNKWSLTNLRKPWDVVLLSEEDIKNGVLRTGQRFDYGRGHTTVITKITCVNTQRNYSSLSLMKMTGGETSDIRNEFARNCIRMKL